MLDQALRYIEKETGLKYGQDYYFIVGTRHPFFCSHKGGFIPSTNRAGYILKKGDKEINIDTIDPKEEVSQVINFLKDAKAD